MRIAHALVPRDGRERSPMVGAGQRRAGGWRAIPLVETDGRGGATMTLPGETEAGSAGGATMPGIAWWSYRCLEKSPAEG